MAARVPLVTLVLHDVTLSMMKLFWFANFADPPFPVPPRLPRPHSLRLVALGMACGAWTRASLVLQGRLAVSVLRASEVSEDDARAVACGELLLSWLLLRAAAAALPLQRSGYSLPARGSAARESLRALALMVAIGAAGEIAHHLLLRALLGPPPSPFHIAGRPAPEGPAGDDECCICLGSPLFEDDEGKPLTGTDLASSSASTASVASMDPAASFVVVPGPDAAWDPDPYLDSSDSDSEGADLPGAYPPSAPRSPTLAPAIHPPSNTPSSDPLESFCRHPTHVAHRRCMSRWIGCDPSGAVMLSRRSGWLRRLRRGDPTGPGGRRRCPLCRGPLVLRLAPVPEAAGGWGWEVDWPMVAARAVVSVGCVAGVAAAVAGREWVAGLVEGWR